MKYVLCCLFAILVLCQVKGQSGLTVKRDSVIIKNEFILQNGSRSVPGVLFNNGDGRTEFKKMRLENLGDTAIAITGQDTIRFKGGGFIVPAAALANLIFTASSTPTDNLQVTGLTPGKRCKITLTANAVSSPRLNRVRINGNVIEFNAVQNSSKAAVFDNLVIPADGKINIAFYAKDASSYAGLASAIIIEEYVN